MTLTDSIGELWDKDPLHWTDQDVTNLIEQLRGERMMLDVNQAPKSAAKKVAEQKVAIAGKTAEELLKGLGL